MPEPILHHYDASPFAQKAQKMLGIKQLDWHSVEMPMTAPKPDIERLTGGYRGTPVLQLGADLFVDNMAIAEALDRFFPERPAITAGSTMLVNDAIGLWCEEFFDPVLRAAVVTYSADWDDHFRADREKVFPHLDFNTLFDDEPLWIDRILVMVDSLDRHLAAGGPFFNGAQVSLADVHCWGILWFVRNGLPAAATGLAALAHLEPWEARMDAVGTGGREEADFSVAWDALEQVEPLPLERPADHPLMGWFGSEVVVKASGADRGEVRGELLSAGTRDMVVGVAQEAGRIAQVHFPRIGYDIRRAAAQ